MAETFETAVDLARQRAIGVEGAIEDVGDRPAFVDNPRSSIVTSSVTEKQSWTSAPWPSGWPRRKFAG